MRSEVLDEVTITDRDGNPVARLARQDVLVVRIEAAAGAHPLVLVVDRALVGRGGVVRVKG